MNASRPLFSPSLAWLLTVAALLVPASAPAAVPAGEPAASAVALARLDPRLHAAANAPGEPVTVWVEFTDKGEAGDPAGVATRLAEARAGLSPRALARRLRARVQPLVDWSDVPVHAPYLEALEATGLHALGVSRWFNMAAVRVPGERLLALASLPHVARVRPVERAARPGDPAIERAEPLDVSAFPPAPAPARRAAGAGSAARLDIESVNHGTTASMLEQVGVAALHDSGYTGAGVLVAVFDNGFNWWDRHEALVDHAIPLDHQRDFILQKWGVQDTLAFGWRHGTQTFGTIAGRKFGTYVGSAFDATFALARTETDYSETHAEMVCWGLAAEWADSLGADVISSSLGYFLFDGGTGNYTYADMDGHTTLVSRAAQIAASKGMLVVNSAGNEGQTAWHWLIAPSDVHGDSLIAVGAVDLAGTPAGFSSYGPSADGRTKPDVCARGVSNPVVAATSNPAAYSAISGTSFSAPIVSGAAACLMQARPEWTPRDVARALRATASHPSAPDDRCGYGVIDALAALAYDPVTGTVPIPAKAGALRLLGANPRRAGDAAVSFAIAGDSRDPGTRFSLDVIDALGRRVRTLGGGLRSAIPETRSWDGRDDDGRTVPAGLYFVTLQTVRGHDTLRLVMLR